MNTTAIVAIAAELAKLTPQEHLLTSELAQKLRGGEPVRTESPKPEPIRRADNRRLRWTDEDTQKVQDFLEDSTIMSDRSRRQAKRALCRELGRTEGGIKLKIFQLQNGTTQ